MRENVHAVAKQKASLLSTGIPGAKEEELTYRVILPILRALGWDDAEGDVRPEAKIGLDSADLALVVQKPRLRRRVLIEVKRPEEPLARHEDQIGKYAARDEAEISVLTNGREWWFYLLRAEGNFHERRFAELDLVEEPARFADITADVIAREGLADSDRGVQRAAGLLDERKHAAKWSAVLPEVWSTLVAGPDEDLVRLLQDKASSNSASPSIEAVRTFLRATAGPSSGALLAEVPRLDDDRRGSFSAVASRSDLSSPQKAPRTGLLVKFGDGTTIAEGVAALCFARALGHMGIERVRKLGKRVSNVDLVSTAKHPKYSQLRLGSYYIMTNTSTITKKELLEGIAASLGVKVSVIIVK